MSTGVLAIIVSVVVSLTMIGAEAAATQQILPAPLAKLDIKEAVFEAWEEYWRQPPGVKTIIVKSIGDPATRLAGLLSGELDLAYGMTGKVLPRVMREPNLRWDRNDTSPYWVMFPGYEEPDSPFRDKRVRQAVSLAINRKFLAVQETQGIGIAWGNWLSPECGDALQGDGTDLPVQEYNPQKAKQPVAEAGHADGLSLHWYVAYTPYLDMGERILTEIPSCTRWATECCRLAKGFTATGTAPNPPSPIRGRSGRSRNSSPTLQHERRSARCIGQCAT